MARLSNEERYKLENPKYGPGESAGLGDNILDWFSKNVQPNEYYKDKLPQPVQAPMNEVPAPAPEMNPIVKDYLMKKMQQPEPAQDAGEQESEGNSAVQTPQMPAPAALAAKGPSLLEQFSPEKYKEALAQSKERQSNIGLSQMASGIGDALARRDSSASDKYYDNLRGNIKDETVGEFNRQKANAISDVGTKKQLDALDPNSEQSKSFRKLVESTMPKIAQSYGDNWANVTAADQSTILDYGKMRETIDARKQQYEFQAQLKKEARDAKAGELSTTRAKQMGLYKNGVAAEDQYLSSTADKGNYDPTASGQWLDNSTWAPNMLKNNKAIESQAAKDAWIESFLRDASGAAIAKSEREAYNKLYFPEPGDPQAVVDNKKHLRDVKMQSAAEGAGLKADAPTPQRSNSFPKTLTKDGHTATVNNAKELKEAKSEGWN